MDTCIKYSADVMNSDELCIDLVYVAEADRGKGIGTSLVLSAIQYARDNNFKTVGLFAEAQDNATDTNMLVDWYRSLGFESDGDCDELLTFVL